MILLAAPAAVAAVYYLIALIAACFGVKPSAPSSSPPVSILKPVRGRDPGFIEAIRSHALQNYPEFEILFGCADAADPALEDVYQLAAEFPRLAIRVVHSPTPAPNGKVGVLTDLAAEAKYPVLLVNDSDIRVAPDYLRTVVAPLEDSRVGLVTCLYRAAGDSWPARWEALGIAMEFAPSVLVARAIGTAGFALGSTMVFRAELLQRIGGFAAFNEYLADDYQLGRRISALGYRVALASAVVETHLGSETWTAAWRHQLRWARTIRVSRTAGYYGYILTQATVWSVVAAMAGWWSIAGAAMAIRMLAGAVTAGRVLRDRESLRWWFLIPLRDLWGFAIWVAGLFGDTVEWRGRQLRLTRDGRILQIDTSRSACEKMKS